MRGVLSFVWWVLVVRGVLAVSFGLSAVLVPEITLDALSLLFIVYALMSGLSLLVAALWASDAGRGWPMLLLEGLSGLLAGIFALMWQGRTLPILLDFVAAWALVTGILELLQAARLRAEDPREWRLWVAGAATMVFGVIAVGLHLPAAEEALLQGSQPLVSIWAVYGLVAGLALAWLGMRLRGAQSSAASPPAPEQGR
jgi:uncharacterized membrane protein HdeD (DUF308 family)